MGNVSDTSSSSDPGIPELATTKLVFQKQLRNELRDLATTDGDPLSIANVPIAANLLANFTNHVWVERRQNYDRFVYGSSGRQELDYSLEDLFEPRGVEVGMEHYGPVNALATGAMGSGKTALTRMLVYLWANGELWPERFDLVAWLSLGNPDVQQARSLEELLALVLGDSAMSDGGGAAEYFERHPARLCLILDGLNECHLPCCSEFVQAVVQVRELRAVRRIVTGRACPAVPVLKKTGLYQRHVEVAGLKVPAVADLIRRQVAAAEHADALLAEIARSLELEALMTSPTFASLSCAAAPTTPSCLAAALEAQVVRAFGSVGVTTAYGLRRDVPPAAAAVLRELGGFALAMTLRHRVTFTDDEVSRLGDETRRLGLVAPHAELGARSCRQRFASLPLQEYLAAWYAVYELIGSKEHAAILVQRLSACSYDLAVFWRYAIALSPATGGGGGGAADWLMSAVWSDAYARKDEKRPLSALHPLDERDVPGITLGLPANRRESGASLRERLYERMSREQMHRLADDLLVRVGTTTAGRRLVYRSVGVADDDDDDDDDDDSEAAVTDAAYMAALLSLWRQRTPATSGVHLHAALERHAPEAAADLKPLLVPEWLLGELGPNAFRLGTGFRSNDAAQVMLMEAYFEHCRLQYAPGSPAPEFDALYSLRGSGMHLLQVTLTPLQCSVAATVLADHGTAAGSWEIGGCHPQDAGMRRLAPVVRHFGGLRWLHLRACGITDGDLLVPVLSGLPALISLHISENAIGDRGLAVICPALTQATNLSTVGIEAMGLTNRSLAVVVDLLGAWKKLHYLHAGQNAFGDAGRDAERAFVRAVKDSSVEQLSMNYKIADSAEQTFAEELKEVEEDVAFSLRRLMLCTFY